MATVAASECFSHLRNWSRNGGKKKKRIFRKLYIFVASLSPRGDTRTRTRVFDEASKSHVDLHKILESMLQQQRYLK